MLRRAAEARAFVERSQDYLAQRSESTVPTERAALTDLAIRKMLAARELLWFLMADLERMRRR